MKNTAIRTLSLVIALLSPVAIATGCAHSGRSALVSHSESDRAGWFGGQTHEANRAYLNSDGSTSVESEITTTKNGTTTITRDRQTTNVDGTVRADRETHTIVKGSDNVVTETRVNN